MQKHTGILENRVLFFVFIIYVIITKCISKSAFKIFLKMNLSLQKYSFVWANYRKILVAIVKMPIFWRCCLNFLDKWKIVTRISLLSSVTSEGLIFVFHAKGYLGSPRYHCSGDHGSFLFPCSFLFVTLTILVIAVLVLSPVILHLFKASLVSNFAI